MPSASSFSLGDIAIHAEALTKDWGRTRAVDAVSLDVRKGEIFGFFGPNGAGKTTTMRMLCGLTAPTGGSATVWGVDVRRDPTGVRANMTIVPEETSFYEKMTARAYLSFFAKLAGNGSGPGGEAVRRASRRRRSETRGDAACQVERVGRLGGAPTYRVELSFNI